MGLRFNLLAKRAALLGYGLRTPQPHSGQYELYPMATEQASMSVGSIDQLSDKLDELEAQCQCGEDLQETLKKDIPL
ncbi:hypothetical protein [Ferrimonas pelagia]|uniref:Uncharacterized protein n=1 Tax=Ferrimonas pelagia TaxID=1177826 RepID=A0ABP9F8S7_9GAMM